jgi:hypothetical protein
MVATREISARGLPPRRWAFLYQVQPATDPNVGFRLSAALLGKDGEWAHGLTFAAAQIVLAGLSGIPFPHATKCPIPVLGCVDQFKLLSSLMSPDPQWDMYRSVRGGQQNARGLTPLGEVAIKEMMKLGMIIDIDHMSDLAANANPGARASRHQPRAMEFARPVSRCGGAAPVPVRGQAVGLQRRRRRAHRPVSRTSRTSAWAAKRSISSSARPTSSRSCGTRSRSPRDRCGDALAGCVRPALRSS